jgi:hypothetical protein
MWTERKRVLVWALVVVVAAPSIHFGAKYLLSRAPGTIAAADFLGRSEELVAVIGDIREVQVVDKLAVAATGREPAYSIYTFVVTGTREERTVEVRVTTIQNADGRPSEQRRLESIR